MKKNGIPVFFIGCLSMLFVGLLLAAIFWPGTQTETGHGLVNTALATAPRPEPWSVVCDNAGKFTFVDENGDVWIKQFDDARDAARYMVTIRRIREDMAAKLGKDPFTREERMEMNEIAAKTWTKCQ